MNHNRFKPIYSIVFSFIISISVFTFISLYYSAYKHIDFCDEIYTYLISNSSNSYYQYQENVWFTNDYTQNILTTRRGSGFETTLTTVGYDVHPPIYFLIFHIFSILAENSASKWIGISINMLCQLVSLAILYFLVYHISKKPYLAMFSCITFSVLPFIISNTLLIRMYAMLSMCVAAYVFISYFIITGMNNFKKHWYMYVLLCIVTICGFLTQYYFSIFAIGFTISYILYCIYKKQPQKTVPFITSMVVAVACSTVLWKQWIQHVFYGYRGQDAFKNFLDIDNLISKLHTGFTQGFEFLFGNHLMYVYIIFVIISIVLLLIKKKQNSRLAFICITFSASQFMSMIILLITPDELYADRFFFASGQCLWICIACLIGYIAELCSKKIYQYLAILALIVTTGYSLTRENYISYIDLSNQEVVKTQQLEQYSEIPWVYYGGETWKLIGNLMDFLIPEDYIILSSNVDYSQNERLQNTTDFILYVVDDYYDPTQAITEMETVLNCSYEYEWLFVRGYSRVLLIHKE